MSSAGFKQSFRFWFRNGDFPGRVRRYFDQDPTVFVSWCLPIIPFASWLILKSGVGYPIGDVLSHGTMRYVRVEADPVIPKGETNTTMKKE